MKLRTIEDYEAILIEDTNVPEEDVPRRVKDLASRQQWWKHEFRLRKIRLSQIKRELSSFVESREIEESKLGNISKARLEAKIVRSPEYKARHILLEEEENVVGYLEDVGWIMKSHSENLRAYLYYYSNVDPF